MEKEEKVKSIHTVAVIGLGALGVMYANHLNRHMDSGTLSVAADENRIEQYRQSGVYCNGELCAFQYVTPQQAVPADLVIVAVKQPSLPEAIRDMRGFIGQNTVIISVLNGITSEQIIGDAFGMDKMLLCTAQGMDAVREGRHVTYANMGWLFLGDLLPGKPSEKAQRVAAFFERMKLPYRLAEDMNKRLWNKFMLNAGVNQAVAVYGTGYGDVQHPGPVRDIMIAAMREVMALANSEGIDLNEEDLEGWLKLLATLNPQGKPSLQQDIEAGRETEVELFAGTAVALGKKHGITTPVNAELYRRIQMNSQQL